MPENTYLYKYLTGDEFLDYAAGFYDISKERIAERKNWVLKKVGLEEARARRLFRPILRECCSELGLHRRFCMIQN